MFNFASCHRIHSAQQPDGAVIECEDNEFLLNGGCFMLYTTGAAISIPANGVFFNDTDNPLKYWTCAGGVGSRVIAVAICCARE